MSAPKPQSVAIGVDLGGTKLAASVVGADGKIRSKVKLPTEKESPDKSIRQIVDVVQKALGSAAISWDQVFGVGLAIPGIYEPETGKAWAPNLWGWDQIPLREELQSRFPVSITLDSDRSAYVLGEQWLGAARGLRDVVFLAVGTGIGAGIISGDKIIRGAQGIAGAVGWFALNPHQKEIYRQMGCWETEAAGPSVARRAAERLAAGEASLLRERPDGPLERLTTEAVVEAARRGDGLARQVLDETITYLGMGVANIISILNPQMVVLGGGLMQAAELLIEPLRREVRSWAQPVAAQQVRIELTQLGEDAGLLGAARLVLMEVR